MKGIYLVGVMFLSLLVINSPAMAGGGSAGVSPATGFKVFFGGGSSDFYIPIRFEAETYLGSSEKHGIGGSIGADIGVGVGRVTVGAISPEYNYYFSGGKVSSPYVGGYVDFRFRGGFNIIGVGGQGGYEHYFNEQFSLYGEGSIGFATAGYSGGYWGYGTRTRTNGGEFGVRVGGKFTF